jgi:argininosuccinate lyase
VVATLRVHPERMEQALLQGFSQATDLAEHVMQSCGVDYRTAYLVVGRAVSRAGREGLRGIDLTGEMLDDAALEQIGRRLGLSGTDLGRVLDPRAIVQTRSAPGGAAPEVVSRMAAGCAEAARTLAARGAALHADHRRAQQDMLRLAAEVAGSAPA